jgi:hypothetical protein
MKAHQKNDRIKDINQKTSERLISFFEISFIQQTYRKFMRKYRRKKVGVAGLQPNTYLHDYSKLLN